MNLCLRKQILKHGELVWEEWDEIGAEFGNIV